MASCLKSHKIYQYDTMTQIKRTAYITLLVILAAFGTESKASDTTPSYSFLNIPASAQVYGLGGINVSNISDDINSIDQNPALMGPNSLASAI